MSECQQGEDRPVSSTCELTSTKENVTVVHVIKYNTSNPLSAVSLCDVLFSFGKMIFPNHSHEEERNLNSSNNFFKNISPQKCFFSLFCLMVRIRPNTVKWFDLNLWKELITVKITSAVGDRNIQILFSWLEIKQLQSFFFCFSGIISEWLLCIINNHVQCC